MPCPSCIRKVPHNHLYSHTYLQSATIVLGTHAILSLSIYITYLHKFEKEIGYLLEAREEENANT